ncbi:unnamed protein product [Closterium sp. NIES-64]|nr:unnamed protein product [Closterium sp. NIES-64]CAI5969889.1 unnamed protein product [Closterium sp. NIES-65]CAI5977098.1 unnamed protein product [Closterium sp. NIES-64]CAI6005013.1 unnamed protein product [Closterium sp. NIES-65]
MAGIERVKSFPLNAEEFRSQQQGFRAPCFASITSSLRGFDAASATAVGTNAYDGGARHLFDVAMSAPQVAKRLEGLAVYTVSNAANEFVLITDAEGSKSIGLFCFRKEDAETLLAQVGRRRWDGAGGPAQVGRRRWDGAGGPAQVKDRDASLGKGARVVPVAMDKVYALSAEGIAFRFLPDPLQVKHAVLLRSQAGDNSKAFDGVPVFQSESLILRSKNRRFCPIFFTKEDLEAAIRKATGGKPQKSTGKGPVNINVQVGSFEDVLKKMEKNEEDSPWGDLLFVPPGRDVDGVVGKQTAHAAAGSSESVLC